MKQFIDKVTVTGADDSILPEDLIELSVEYPFVEWGILFSKSSEGLYRFPSKKWLKDLYVLQQSKNLNFSAHICGSWVRNICNGQWTFLEDHGDILDMFSRIQLNFHAIVHKLLPDRFIAGFNKEQLYFKQFIFQLDDINNSILDVARAEDIDAVGLFDLSGGLGILPQKWPVAKGYCGYAGGLSPTNLNSQLELIEQVALDGPIWIDVETHVRSDNDKQFDLNKVRDFLAIASNWVCEGISCE